MNCLQTHERHSFLNGKEEISKEFKELLDFLKKIKEDDYDKETADEILMNLIQLNKHDNVLLQCLCADDGTSLLELCSRLHFPLCQEFLLKNALYNPHALSDECKVLTEACRQGYVTVVKLLLMNNVQMSAQSICTSDSPFYIASYNGYVNILELMVKSNPYLIKKDIRKMLLLSACMGGHLDAVKYWFKFQVLPSPEMCVDKKNTVEVSQYNPLYITCKEKHMDVMKYLIDEGFSLTERMCTKFPDVIKTFLLMDYDTSDPQLEIHWPHLRLPKLINCWVEDIKTNITVLNISYNKLSEFPSCLPWEIPNLVTFNVSNNHLSKFPVPAGEILCKSLKILILSHNKLKMLCSEVFQIPSLKEIYASNNQLVFLTEDEELFHGCGKFFTEGNVSRKCPNLSILNVSYNTLQLFPEVLQCCPNLTKLYASHNQLCRILNPWSCPLDTLDLSHNFLTEISSSLENFWSSTLQYVDLSYNQLTEISDSIVSLYSLSELRISNNKILSVPCSKSWSCVNLKVLDLGNNNLGLNTDVTSKGKSNFFKQPSGESEFDLDIPKAVLRNLNDVNLQSNKLLVVPPCVFEMKSLIFLNLNGNPNISRLPEQLGLLENCKSFTTEGLDIVNVPKEIQEADKKGQAMLRYLQYKKRNSKPHCCMKLSVMGPEGKGKTSLIKSLTKGNVKNLKTSTGLSTCSWTTAKKMNLFAGAGSIPSITFNIWEFSKPEKFSDIHNCFISKNSLFLLVWDIRKSISELEPFLMSIESKTMYAVIMLVGTFLDQVPSNKEELIKGTLSDIKTLCNKKYGTFTIVNLWTTCPPTNAGVKELAAEIFNVAKNIKHKGELLLCRKIPQSYINLAGIIQQGIPMKYCFEDEFKKFVEGIEGNDILSPTDLQRASIFLHKIGVLFYQPEFNNTSLYFFDPVWLFDLLGKIFTDERFQSCFVQQGKLCLKRSRVILDSFLPKDDKLDYTGLLETFGIALRIDKDILFVPSLLLDNPPGINMAYAEKKLVRLIKMWCIPPGFWNQLMIQVMIIMEHLKNNMIMAYRISNAIDSHKRKIKSWNKYERSHEFSSTQIIYWKKGLIVSYQNGNFQICIKNEGILITVHTFNEDFFMMGLLMNELENLADNYFPGLINDFSTYAVCPNCYPEISDTQMTENVDHFCIEQCAYALMSSYFIKCSADHKILLENLIPELMLMHIPSKFHLDKNEIECLDFIASGASGSVFVGQYKKQNVALKFYQQKSTLHSSKKSRGSSLNNSWKEQSEKKIINASYFKDNVQEFVEGKMLLMKLRELQHEVLLLSYLNHPCIISLVGFILRPLCMVLELAPMRSLRLVLNTYMNNRNKEEALLPKMLTYRILLQIGEGMNYLHKKGIIYRDLKTDNILVWSMSLDCKVNVKLSDYNFSRYSISKGMITPAGTPGYQAPEILTKQIYNEKVDIYSWSMVAYEIQSGLTPFHRVQSAIQVSEMVLAKKRPSLKEVEIESKFPCLDELMILSHDHLPSNRPSATQILFTMRKMSFLFLKNIIQEPLTHNNIDTQFLFNNDKGRQMIWLWEGQDEIRKYHIIDNTSQSVMCRSVVPGSQVICQTNFNKSIWLITQNNEIEILKIENQRYKLEIIETLKLPYKALAIKSQEEKGQVYVCLSNGVLMIFQKDSVRKLVTSWDKSYLELSKSHEPLSTLEIVHNELWVSSTESISIVCLDKLIVLQEVNYPYTCSISSSCFTPTGQIFYQLQDSAKVLQFDVNSRQLVFVYDFSNLKLVGKVAEAQNLDAESTDDIQKDEECFCLVQSILLVDDALWVSRDIGDILIVCTDEGSAYKRGFVITALFPSYLLPPNERMVGAKGLNSCTDKSVISFIETEDDNLVRNTRICYWEEYSIDEIYQIKSHILELQSEEKKNSKKSFKEMEETTIPQSP